MQADFPPPARMTRRTARKGLVIGALGVVFGDIGTSPIYTLQLVFNPGVPRPVPMRPDHIYGVVSLIFWSVMAIVTLTYVTLLMRADNDGEGGVMALTSLVSQIGNTQRARAAGTLAIIGIFGAALFFGDSMITPAISVLSAVEGLKVIDPELGHYVVPITVVIIIGLFGIQRHGTAMVGRFFGPVMVLWFLAIAASGIRGIVGHPGILRALSPTYALEFMAGHFHIAFFALAAIVLAVTGAEALYADMGHFGRFPIVVAWLALVLPALVLNYFGQGALLLRDESVVTAPFFLLTPGWAQVPMILLATAATVIASQAVITGAYSVAAQATQLGYLPRLRVTHTSASSMGQIYIPWINGVLMVLVLVLILTFRSSAALGYAYGMAITGTITISTLLFFYIARARWRWPLWAVMGGGAALIVVDLMFVAANLTKLSHGAWLPLLIATVTFTVLITWHRGHTIVVAARDKAQDPLREIIGEVVERTPPLPRIPGTAVFPNWGTRSAPLAIRANITNNHSLHERVIILSIDSLPVPRVADADRISVTDLGDRHDGIYFVVARFGYLEIPAVPPALRLIDPTRIDGPVDIENVVYFVSELDLRAGPQPSMARWRKRLFITIAHLTADTAGSFALPPDRTVVVGTRIEV